MRLTLPLHAGGSNCVRPLLVLLALTALACGDGREATPAPPTPKPSTPARDPSRAPDLLLIGVDTLRADHLGCYGSTTGASPFIDSLAREGVLFREATSAAPITLPSHATMLTGLVPAHHGARDNTGFTVGESVVTLAERLDEAGYQTGAFIGALPLAKVGGLAQGFDVYDDAMPQRALGGVATREERSADQVLAVANAWLMGTDARRPTFAFVHLFDPHSPHEKFLGRAAEPSYDGEISFVDHQLSMFVSDLRNDPRWRDLVVVLTSDHGEGLGDHGEASHCIFIYQSTLHVPLIVSAPARFAPRAVSDVVGLVDLMPTLCDLAGLPALDGLDGRSLLPALRGEPLEPRDYAVESLFGALNFGWAPLRGLRSGSMKLIDAPRPELFDLASDPKELANLHAQRAEEAARLAAKLATPSPSSAPQSQEDRDRMESLEALGYVSARPAKGAEDRADPKDRIADYDAFQRAHVEFASGKTAQAVATMQSLEPRLSKSPYFYLELGNFAGELGDLDEAARAYSRCLELEPGNVDARLNLGVIRLQEGDARGALNAFEALLAKHPDHAEAHLYAGIVLGKNLNDEKGALEHWKRFVELAPSHPEAAKIRRVLENAK